MRYNSIFFISVLGVRVLKAVALFTLFFLLIYCNRERSYYEAQNSYEITGSSVTIDINSPYNHSKFAELLDNLDKDQEIVFTYNGLVLGKSSDIFNADKYSVKGVDGRKLYTYKGDNQFIATLDNDKEKVYILTALDNYAPIKSIFMSNSTALYDEISLSSSVSGVSELAYRKSHYTFNDSKTGFYNDLSITDNNSNVRGSFCGVQENSSTDDFLDQNDKIVPNNSLDEVRGVELIIYPQEDFYRQPEIFFYDFQLSLNVFLNAFNLLTEYQVPVEVSWNAGSFVRGANSSPATLRQFVIFVNGAPPPTLLPLPGQLIEGDEELIVVEPNDEASQNLVFNIYVQNGIFTETPTTLGIAQVNGHFAVVTIGDAHLNGITFTHELGHILGGFHTIECFQYNGGWHLDVMYSPAVASITSRLCTRAPSYPDNILGIYVYQIETLRHRLNIDF